ncbi:MAG: flagellar basal body-associated FliL family protein [Candidatus Latescibacteria bacterium]|jgi:flagellar basal body-associated protein FliL|nr:flagellar basal body-associated FliL family protein [Candidatus Latescibacterota bacterium]
MADEEEAVDDLDEESKPAINPGRYILLILGILAIEGAGGYLLLDRAIPPREVYTAKKEVKEEDTQVVDPVFFTDLQELVVNPAGGGYRNFLVQASLALQVDSDVLLEELYIKRETIWDLSIQKLETFSVSQLRDPVKREVRESLKRAINPELRNGEVVAVLFTDFVLQ